MNHVDAGHHLEQFAGHVGRRAVAGGRHVEFAGVGLGVGDEFGNGLGRNRWIHLHDVRKTDETSNRRDVVDEIEIQLFE